MFVLKQPNITLHHCTGRHLHILLKHRNLVCLSFTCKHFFRRYIWCWRQFEYVYDVGPGCCAHGGDLSDCEWLERTQSAGHGRCPSTSAVHVTSVVISGQSAPTCPQCRGQGHQAGKENFASCVSIGHNSLFTWQWPLSFWWSSCSVMLSMSPNHCQSNYISLAAQWLETDIVKAYKNSKNNINRVAAARN